MKHRFAPPCAAYWLLGLSVASVRLAEGQKLPSRQPMENPPPVTGGWRLASPDTGMLAFLDLSIVESGTPAASSGARHANGSWSALNQGCPAKPECQFHGAVVGSSAAGTILLKLLPATPGGIGAALLATRVAADSLLGSLTLEVGSEQLNSSLVFLVRAKP